MPLLPAQGHPAISAAIAFFVICLFLSTAATNIAALVLTGISLALWIKWKPFALLRTPLAVTCLLLLAWLFVRDLAASASVRATLKQLNDFRPFLFIVLWAPLFSALAHRRAAAATFLACSAAFWLAALGSLLFTREPINAHGFNRSHDLAGPLLVVAVLAGAQLGISDRSRRWWWAAFAVLGSVALFFASGRRTGYVALLIGAGAVVLMNIPRLNLRAFAACVAALLAAVALLAASPHARERAALVYSEAQQFSKTEAKLQGQTRTSTGLRLRFWLVTKEVIKSAPILGVGVSTFEAAYLAADERLGGSVSPTRNPHNEYLYMLAGLGIPGLALYLAVQGIVVRRGRAFPQPAHSRILWMAMLVFMVSILYNSMVVDTVPGHFYALTVLCLAWFPWTGITSLPWRKPPPSPS